MVTTMALAGMGRGREPLLKYKEALAGMAQCIEPPLANQRVAGSIPSQGTCLDCRPDPQWGAHDKQPHIDVSFSFSLPSPLSKNKLKKIF